MRRCLYLVISCLLCFLFLQAAEETGPGGPWLTGPLLTFSGTVMDKGQIEIAPYVYSVTNTGEYNKDWKSISIPHFHNIVFPVFLYYGITKTVDVLLIPQVVYNKTQGQSFTYLGDFSSFLDYQLIFPDKYKWFPGIKVSVGETFPLGKYQKLNPHKKKTDSTGNGVFQSNAQMILYKLLKLPNKHYLSLYLDFIAAFSPPVHVKGFNTYGGGFGTRGKVYQGATFNGIFSFEYTFTQNWAFAMDTYYIHKNKTRFTGQNGIDETGRPATSKSPSSEQLSFTPSLEYNFTDSLGIIGGAWFSALGRNSDNFRGFAIGLYYAN